MANKHLFSSFTVALATLALLTSCPGNSSWLPTGDGEYCTGDWTTCKVFYEEKFAVALDDLWGYIDEDGDTVIDFEFAGAGAFANGIAVVQTGTLYNIINGSGTTIIAGGYDYIYHDVAEGVLLYEEDGHAGILGLDGEKITEPIFDDVMGEFSAGLLAVGFDGLYGYVDKTGDFVIPATYAEAYTFTEGLGLVKTDDDLYGFVNATGSLALPAIYPDAWSFDAYERAIVQVNESDYALINKTGTQLVTGVDINGYGPIYNVEFGYDDIRLYKADGTRFNNQTYTYVNFYGEYLANVEWDNGDIHYDEIVLFDEDGTIVKSAPYSNGDWIIGTDNTEYVIDQTEGIVISSAARDIEIADGAAVIMITDTHIIYNNGVKTGAVTLAATPQAAIPFDYDQMMLLSDDYAIVGQEYMYGVVTLTGQPVIDLLYSDFNIFPFI